MLVLTRNLKEGVSLFIGNTEVRVVFAEQRQHNKVRLAFDCPDFVIIKRDEIVQHPDAKAEAKLQSVELMKRSERRGKNVKKFKN
jgi:sRNA-binding carbon storage regulator CsrA